MRSVVKSDMRGVRYVSALLAASSMAVIGCRGDPVDPASRSAALEAAAQAVEAAGSAGQAVAPLLPPPWDIVAIGLGALAGYAAGKLRRRRGGT